MDLIVYTDPNTGVLAIVIPAPECGLSIVDVANKDVPTGVPYRFIPYSALPADHVFRDAWEIDMSQPDGVGL